MSAFLFANCVIALKIVCSAGTNRKLAAVNEDESRQNDAWEQKSRYEMSKRMRE